MVYIRYGWYRPVRSSRPFPPQWQLFLGCQPRITTTNTLSLSSHSDVKKDQDFKEEALISRPPSRFIQTPEASTYILLLLALPTGTQPGFTGTLWLHPRCISRNLSHIKMTINIEGVSSPSFSLSIHGNSSISVISWVVGDLSFSPLPSLLFLPRLGLATIEITPVHAV